VKAHFPSFITFFALSSAPFPSALLGAFHDPRLILIDSLLLSISSTGMKHVMTMRALFSTLQKIVIILIFSAIGLLRDVLRNLRDRTWVGTLAVVGKRDDGTLQRPKWVSLSVLFLSLPFSSPSLSRSASACCVVQLTV
jgi:hypothetical protein